MPNYDTRDESDKIVRTAAEFANANKVLARGDIGHESDTLSEKTGDGATSWNDLPYSGGPNMVTTAVSDSTAARAAVVSVARAGGKMLNGSRWLIVGDSISILGTTGIQGQSYTTFLPWRSGGRLREVARTAVSGSTSTLQLAAVRAVISADTARPTLASILVGTNDLGQGVSIETWKSNVTAMTQELRSAGCESVLFTLPPRSGPATPVAPAILNAVWNGWLRKYARENGFPLVDFWRIAANSATGEYKTGWFDTSDGVHPNAVAMKALSDEAYRVLNPVLMPASQIETRTLFDGNLLTGGVFTSATLPASWTKAGNGWTAVVDTAAPGGYAAQLTSDVNPVTRPDFHQMASITPGLNHRYLVTITFRVVSATDVIAGSGMRLSILENAAAPATTHAVSLFGQSTPTDEYLTHQFEFTPDDNTNGIRPYFQYIKGSSLVTNQITARVAALGLYDLTDLGLA